MNDALKAKAWKVGIVAGVFLALFLLIVSIKAFREIGYVGKEYPVMNTISIVGKGEEFAIPDIATFSFSVTEEGKTVEEAQGKATTKANAALDAIKKNGIEEKDIKTTAYNINPRYDYVQELCTASGCRSGRQVLRGYEVSQTTEVKVRDIKKAGALFETVGSLGVQNVNSLAFSIDDIETVKAKARTEAIADAKAKAKVLSKELGVKIVKINSFYDSSDDVYYGYGRDVAMMESANVKSAMPAAAPSIPTGEQKVTSRVTITYEIR